MAHPNTAIVTDTAIAEAVALLRDRVVTPSTLFALNSVVQAVVLHDKVVLGLAALAGAGHETRDVIQEGLGSEIAIVPPIGEFHVDVPAEVYSTVLYWLASERLSCSLTADAEVNHLALVRDYLLARKAADITDPEALETSFGVTQPFGSRTAVVCDDALYGAFLEAIRAKKGEPISPNDLLAIRDVAWAAMGGYTLSRCLHVTVYHALIERPFYGSELRNPKGPLDIARRVTSELEVTPEFGDIDVPPFLGLVFREPTFERRDFWKILLDVRENHRSYRHAVGEFEVAWNGAKTRGEQRQLVKAHERAWRALLDQEEYRAKERVTYMLGRAAASLGKSVMTDLIERDRATQAVDAVGGLVRLWADVQDVMPSSAGRNTLARHFGELPTASHWEKVRLLVSDVNSAVGLRGI